MANDILVERRDGGVVWVTLNREDGLTLVLMTHDDAVAARGTRRVRLHEGALLA